jgi:hypothetical protein
VFTDPAEPLDLRLAAGKSLGALRAAAFPELHVCLDLLCDPETPPAVAQEALKLLDGWGAGAVPVLTELAVVAPSAIQLGAINRIGQLAAKGADARSALPVLRGLSDDNDLMVKAAARTAIERVTSSNRRPIAPN